jgi:hypothetical protein
VVRRGRDASARVGAWIVSVRRTCACSRAMAISSASRDATASRRRESRAGLRLDPDARRFAAPESPRRPLVFRFPRTIVVYPIPVRTGRGNLATPCTRIARPIPDMGRGSGEKSHPLRGSVGAVTWRESEVGRGTPRTRAPRFPAAPAGTAVLPGSDPPHSAWCSSRSKTAR